MILKVQSDSDHKYMFLFRFKIVVSIEPLNGLQFNLIHTSFDGYVLGGCQDYPRGRTPLHAL